MLDDRSKREAEPSFEGEVQDVSQLMGDMFANEGSVPSSERSGQVAPANDTPPNFNVPARNTRPQPSLPLWKKVLGAVLLIVYAVVRIWARGGYGA